MVMPEAFCIIKMDSLLLLCHWKYQKGSPVVLMEQLYCSKGIPCCIYGAVTNEHKGFPIVMPELLQMIKKDSLLCWQSHYK